MVYMAKIRVLMAFILFSRPTRNKQEQTLQILELLYWVIESQIEKFLNLGTINILGWVMLSL